MADTGTSEPRSSGGAAKQEVFYDHKFSIEAMQHEPYQDGFTWRAVIGAFFIAFVMLPGAIFMGLMIGADLGTAADWVTIILFVEVARRSFVTLKKQELYILRYTVSHLSHAGGGLVVGGGVFAVLVAQRYLKTSEAFHNFGLDYQLPSWYAPYGDAVYNSFASVVWLKVIGVLVLSMVLSKLTMLSLGFLAYKVTADVEKLPFPLSPIHAEGAIALAETSQDANKQGFRQYCFSVGTIIGATFGLFYVAIPTLSQAFLQKSIQLIPIPFLDLTRTFENVLPTATVGLVLNIGVIIVGFVMPWRIVLGMFFANILFTFVLNPFVFHPAGILQKWTPGKDAIQTQVANSLDLYLSVGIGVAFAIFAAGVWGIVKALIKYRKNKEAGEGAIDISQFWHRDTERGDPPVWVALVVWMAAAGGYVALSNQLINGGLEAGEARFPIWWLISFAFLWTPINTYVNARMIGIAGQHASVPFLMESAIWLSQFRAVTIWPAPKPLADYGAMTDLLRQLQLTRTRFTSILKAELLIFPLLLVASFLFWTYISSLGPIPSDNYPYVQKFWPQHAIMTAVWWSSMQEGNSMLVQAIKPAVIGVAFAAVTVAFGLFSALGWSVQFIYGALNGYNNLPHSVIPMFIGACLGRFYFRQRFGAEQWTSFAPILSVGFGAGMGLVGMLAIAINFLWQSIGTTN